MKSLYAIIIALFFFSCLKEEGKILATERSLTESVYASVIIQPDSLYQVFSIVSGIIEQNLIEEGDIVKKNQALIQIINNTPQLNTKNAKLALEFARENYKGNATILKSIRDEIVAVKLTYKNDSVNFLRQQNLWNQQIGSKVEFDTRKLKFQLSANNLKLLINKYNQTKNELETVLHQANNNYQTSLINTKDFTIKSKINGKVYELKKEPGEIVNNQESLALVGSETHFIIELLVDEVDIIRISVQQQVIVNLDAYQDQVFKGKVTKIYPKKDERNQTFKVEATFDSPPKKLYPGLSGEANIIIATKGNVLTIPKNYITNDHKVKTVNGFVQVTIGLQNLEFVEILSGITKDTYLFKLEQ
jgi:HlyD family secretion protein